MDGDEFALDFPRLESLSGNNLDIVVPVGIFTGWLMRQTLTW
jgi:hypothetical protein